MTTVARYGARDAGGALWDGVTGAARTVMPNAADGVATSAAAARTLAGRRHAFARLALQALAFAELALQVLIFPHPALDAPAFADLARHALTFARQRQVRRRRTSRRR